VPGWAITVDFPIKDGPHRLREEVQSAGGRLYFTGDSCTTPPMIRQMYPRRDEWRKIGASVDPDGIFRTDLSRRLAL
jgi:decaprenylphospho-beta-D-ribofuranose 2-oxidase